MRGAAFFPTTQALTCWSAGQQVLVCARFGNKQTAGGDDISVRVTCVDGKRSGTVAGKVEDAGRALYKVQQPPSMHMHDCKRSDCDVMVKGGFTSWQQGLLGRQACRYSWRYHGCFSPSYHFQESVCPVLIHTGKRSSSGRQPQFPSVQGPINALKTHLADPWATTCTDDLVLLMIVLLII